MNALKLTYDSMRRRRPFGEGLIIDEARDEVKGPAGLISGHHVPCIAHQHFRQLPCLFHVPCQFIPDVPLLPRCCPVLSCPRPIQLLQRRHTISSSYSPAPKFKIVRLVITKSLNMNFQVVHLSVVQLSRCS